MSRVGGNLSGLSNYRRSWVINLTLTEETVKKNLMQVRNFPVLFIYFLTQNKFNAIFFVYFLSDSLTPVSPLFFLPYTLPSFLSSVPLVSIENPNRSFVRVQM